MYTWNLCEFVEVYLKFVEMYLKICVNLWKCILENCENHCEDIVQNCNCKQKCDHVMW